MTWDAKRLIRPDRPLAVFWALAAFSAAVYVGASLALRHSIQVSTLEADESEYYRLAGDLIHGRYIFNARRPPGHFLTLGLLRWLTGDRLVAVQVLVSVLFSLSGPLMYLLVRKMSGRHALALSVGLLTIFWPPFLYYGNTLYSETTALPLFILMLLWLPRGDRIANQLPGDGIAAVLAGLFLGLCMLFRPMYLLFAPMAGAIIFLEERAWTVALRRTALLAGGCALVVVPWSAYLSAHAGRLVVVSANGGETVSGGLTPVLLERRGTYTAPNGRTTWWGPGKWLPEGASGYLSEAELKLPYSQRDVLLRERTVAWVLRNPGSALYIQGAKLLYMWGFHPFWNGIKQTLFGNVPSAGMFLMGLALLVRFRKYDRLLCRFWLLPLFASAVALVSWGSWRFRQPGDLGLIVLGVVLGWSLLFPVREPFMSEMDSGRDDLPAPLDEPRRTGAFVGAGRNGTGSD